MAVRRDRLSPVLEDESQGEYDALVERLIAELAPQGALERLLVERIAAVHWRLARVPRLERELSATQASATRGPDPVATDAPPIGPAFDRLARYEVMLERSLSRALAELRRLGAERQRHIKRSARLPVPGRGRARLVGVADATGLSFPRRLDAPAYRALGPLLRRWPLAR